jgi:hypothetical protein
MHGHGKRKSCYILGEGVFQEPTILASSSGCPVNQGSNEAESSPFKFGRLFQRPRKLLVAKKLDKDESIKGLIQLGLSMNDPQQHGHLEPEDSNIPAGYTYLGQFIAHEITFHDTKELPVEELQPQNLRSPSIDLDSLYGPELDGEERRRLYEDDFPPRLKIGRTRHRNHILPLPNDLFRTEEGKAVIADPRNDENLAIAQMHVAFIKFHNAVVEKLKETHSDVGALFECARAQVIRHFQWIVLHDYLPRLVDKNVLECVLKHGLRWFRIARTEDLFMPLEFSAAAFRMGHSMVRGFYQWNIYHADNEDRSLGSAKLCDLFDQTEFSGHINKAAPALQSDWVIDWRRFFEFPEDLGYNKDRPTVNMARRLDPYFNLHLNKIAGFPHHDLPEEKQSITVRNLLRGFAFGLPTGEELAQFIGETPLSDEEVASGPYQELLLSPLFKGKTPLWYYILKEAELNGGSRLGPVGSRIVAETLVGVIKNSRYSILNEHNQFIWYPSYGRGEAGTESATFEMVDLLSFADVVNSLGE